MTLLLNTSAISNHASIAISGSKSETNRLLLLAAFYPEILLENASVSDDSTAMRQALQSEEKVINVGHAGTTMRFLTAFFSIQPGRTVTLTGSSRMKERPIKILVDALQSLGADIAYQEKVGYPPIKITGKKLVKNAITIDASVSSQYISALLLIAPKLENGLEVTLTGKATSHPYIKMTCMLLEEIGVKIDVNNKKISVCYTPKVAAKILTVASDWSSASYFYAMIALSDIGKSISLSHFCRNSLQGDSILPELYAVFGVDTKYENNRIIISKTAKHQKSFERNLIETPDIAQTIAVTCFGLGMACTLTGLHTLKIKETDRLQALKNELKKLGGFVALTNNSITIRPSGEIVSNVLIKTYHDHRMAMAFAPLALRVPIGIENPEVVSKSYTDFWKDLEKIGIGI